MNWRRFRGGPGAASQDLPSAPSTPRPKERAPFSLARAYEVAQVMSRFEARLRGYELYDCPVALEPAFVPLLSPLLNSDEELADLEVRPHDEVPLAFVRVLIPAEQKVGPSSCAALLHSLATLVHPVSLEIVGSASSIWFQVVCCQGEEARVHEALRLAFPLATSLIGCQEGDDALHLALAALAPSPKYQVVDLGLSRPSYEPLPDPSAWAPDPLAALVGVLGSLGAGEIVGVQVLGAPARQAWEGELRDLIRYWRDWGDKDEPDARLHKATARAMEAALQSKLSSPLWACAPRIFAVASVGGPGRTLELCQSLGASLPAGNGLMALDDADYPVRDHLLDVLARRSRRPGMLLSAAELAALWHPPTETLLHPRVVRISAPVLPAEVASLPGAALGRLDSALSPGGGASEEMPIVPWPTSWRERHFYALGATRMGKSTLLLNMMTQDLHAGRGLCLVDPHGDLARDVLSLVPAEREEDVFFLDLSDAAFPPAIGLLDAANEWEERLLVSDLLSILRRLFATSWGDRLEHLLRHALLTLIADSGTTHTLRDVRPLLSDEVYQAKVLSGVRDRDLQMFWEREFPAYPASALSPLANKLGLLFSSPIVRNIVGGRASKLHFSELMQGNKVVLVDASAGKIGGDGARFLGALLVSRLQLSAMHSLRLDRLERSPFTLYVDEFHAFAVSSFETILSEAGKAGLHLVMANQFLEQLDPQLQTAILSNVGTLLSFRVSASSARTLEKEFGGVVAAETLVDLSRGEAAVRLGRAGNTVRIRTLPPPVPMDPVVQRERSERIRQRTREQLCRPRAEVEAELFSSHSPAASVLADEDPFADDQGRGTTLPSPGNPNLDSQDSVASGPRGGPQQFGWAEEDEE